MKHQLCQTIFCICLETSELSHVSHEANWPNLTLLWGCIPILAFMLGNYHF